METLWQDLRYGARMLLRNPAFTGVAILSLALGIGANATIFSLVNAILLRPLPVDKPEQLVRIYTSDFSGPAFGTSSYPDFLDFREKSEVLSGLLACSTMPMSMTVDGESERVIGEMVTANYFSLLGIHPALGRAFRPEEDEGSGKHPFAILSHGLWVRRFGSDPGLVGRTLTLNGASFVVIGIGPEGFGGIESLSSVDLWVPMTMLTQFAGRDRLSQRGSRFLMIAGRLKPAATVPQVEAAFQVLAQQLKEAYPQSWIDVKQQGRRISVVPESQARVPPRMRGDIQGFMGLLMAVVGLVLLIACANIANLLLARASGRRKEIAIRLSLGAGRGRLVRQLMTESVLLALSGGAVGLLVSFWLSGLLIAFKPPIPIPIALNLSMDWRVLSFTFGLSVLTGVIFGLAPALNASRPDLVLSLKDETRSSSGGASQSWLRSSFVVAQVALSLLLLISAGLFLRSLRNANAIDPGFDPNNIVMMSFNLQLQGYAEPRMREFQAQILERVRGLPGVVSASLSASVPLSLSGSRRRTVVEGYEPQPGEDMEFHYNIVTPEYLQTMRIQLARGRFFGPEDRGGAPGVVIVNETFARRFWPSQDPLGKRLSMGGPRADVLEVVGVARDGKYNTLGEPLTPFLYLPLGQQSQSALTLMVRTSTEPRSALATVRGVIRELDRALPVTDIKTMLEHLGLSLFPARMAATLLGGFGAVALLLAATGIYGVMAYSVSQRTRELGVRMALGADRRDVLLLIARQGVKLMLAGMILGIAAALALTHLLAGLLYGISATDPVTFAGNALLLGGVAILASLIPARRATRIDPMMALRYE